MQSWHLHRYIWLCSLILNVIIIHLHWTLKVKIADPKVKKSFEELPPFDLDTVNNRLRAIGPHATYTINLPDNVKFTAVPQQFISNRWGGDPQSTYLSIGKTHILEHGLNDFLFPNSLFNPNCPLIPGEPGLMYEPDGLSGSTEDAPGCGFIRARDTTKLGTLSGV